MQRSAVTHTRQHKAAIAILRHSTRITALDTAPAMHAQDTHRTYRVWHSHDASHFAGPTRTTAHMPTSAAFPDTITPRTRARTDTHEMRQAPPNTTPRQRHGVSPNTAPRLQPTHRTSHTHIQHATHNPARPHNFPHSANHCALRKHHCSHAAARNATHGTVHSSALPAHCPQKITPSHTRGLRATLTSELSGCSASTGCCRRVGCSTSATACRIHDQPSRHTMAPDADAEPSQPPATHRIASHSINQIKSNEASQRTACYRSRITPCASDTHTTLPDSPQVPDSHPTTQATDTVTLTQLTTRHTATPCTCQQALGTQQQRHSNCQQRVNAARDAHAEQRHNNVWPPKRIADTGTQPRA